MDLYYYTTVETMRYIITNGDIYATNIRYMNDSEEYSNGLREMRTLLDTDDDYSEKADKTFGNDAYQKMLNETSDIYSISFSKANDLLSQWHMYARESGVQLKMCFDGRRKYKYYSSSADKDLPPSKREKSELPRKQVYYLTRTGMPASRYISEGKKILQEFSQILKESSGYLEEEMVSICKDLAPYIKNYGFRQEEEVRSIFTSKENELTVQYRNDRGVLKPYLDIEMEKGWPITNIMVGPGRNQSQVFQSICHFLEHTKLKIDRISDSELVKLYFKGMKTYSVSDNTIETCKNKVLQLDKSMKKMGVKYSEKIQETLNQNIFNCDNSEDKKVVQSYIENNYFCDKGIIVSKSILPYEF